MHLLRRLRRGVAATAALALLATVGGAPAHATNAGGGTVTGTVVYSGPGVPALGEPCRPTSFTLVNTLSHAFVLNTAIAGYAGPVTISGYGSTICETATNGQGVIALLAVGTGPTGSTIHCQLSGTFIRFATEVSLIVTGPCTLNAFPTPSNVVFVAEVNFAPDEPGAGVTGPVTSASFQGTFVVAG